MLLIPLGGFGWLLLLSPIAIPDAISGLFFTSMVSSFVAEVFTPNLGLFLILLMGIAFIAADVAGAILLTIVNLSLWCAASLLYVTMERTVGYFAIVLAFAIGISFVSFAELSCLLLHVFFEDGRDNIGDLIKQAAESKSLTPFILVPFFTTMEVLFALGYDSKQKKVVSSVCEQEAPLITHHKPYKGLW